MLTITDARTDVINYSASGIHGPSYLYLNGTAAPGHKVEVFDAAGQVPYASRSYTSETGAWRIEIVSFSLEFTGGSYTYTARDTVTGEISETAEVVIASAAGQIVTGPVLATTITGPTFLLGHPADSKINAPSYPGGSNTFVAYSLAPDADGHYATGAQIVVHGGYRSTLVMPVALDELTRHHLYVTPNTFSGSTLTLETADARVRADQDITTLRFNDVTLTVQRDPLVDFLFYDTRYRDVATLDLNVRQHYDSYGWHEGRDPSASFDTSLYLAFNPDVAKSGMDPLAHYLQFGIEEGRKISPVVASGLVQDGFDPLYYKLANPDVGFSNMDPLAHYETFGWREGRNPDAFFDTRWYLAHNPDVAAAGVDPLAHYEVFGWHEGRDPSSHFNTQAYLVANPDVAAAGIDPLDHFLQFGVAEGRSAQGDLF